MPAMPDIRIGIIGGSGLGEALLRDMGASDAESHVVDTPFGAPSGAITTARVGSATIAILLRHGEGHVLNPSTVPYRANIYALKALGCTHLIASGATGSLREEIAPGDLVLCDQFIDRTSRRASTFYEHAAVHVELSEPVCPVMHRWLVEAAQSLSDVKVHEAGTYVCMEGPGFSTRAESLLHRQWGADLIGMTALPEAKLAREAEMAYALVALPTDYDCWRPHESADGAGAILDEIIANLQHATQASIALIKAALADTSTLSEPSPAHDALRLAIWSSKAQIPADEVKRLEVLWGRYF
jgi:5'-methylthioadenosine phosphorylase